MEPQGAGMGRSEPSPTPISRSPELVRPARVARPGHAVGGVRV